jgi:hypothetical protein
MGDSKKCLASNLRNNARSENAPDGNLGKRTFGSVSTMNEKIVRSFDFWGNEKIRSARLRALAPTCLRLRKNVGIDIANSSKGHSLSSTLL